MARPKRLEPTVFLAMISPVTVGLVAGTVALVLLAGGPWWLAALIAALVWAIRVLVSTHMARRIAALPRRIDPFALREPWRFFVRDALQARARFVRFVDEVEPGPLRDRLVEISGRVDRGVEECWEVAQRGQKVADTRRAIDVDRARGVLDADEIAADDPRRTSAEVQIASHDRLRDTENETRASLEVLDSRLEESVVRAAELSARAADANQLDEIADAVDGIVGDLEALRLGLDAAERA